MLPSGGRLFYSAEKLTTDMHSRHTTSNMCSAGECSHFVFILTTGYEPSPGDMQVRSYSMSKLDKSLDTNMSYGCLKLIAPIVPNLV